MRPSARTHLTGILLLFVLVAFCGAVSPKGDIDGNNSINSLDLAQLADRWLAPECEYSSCQENLDGVDGVNSRDLAILAEYWGAKGTNLVINEFMARNKYNNYAVVQGQVVYPDWLEIHNPGPDEIYLGGWYLTDNEKKLRKWPLPRRYLGAGGHMLIFASGIELEDHPENLPYWDGSYYHTNFTLGGDGGYLALVDPHEYIIHEYRSSEYGFNDFGYPQQYQDVSYGLYNGVEQYLPNPSPRAANYPGYERMSGVPYFSHPGGTFVGTLDLSLTHPAQGSVIRYTTNGTVPSETSTEYTGPIPLVYTTEVIARVFEPGKAPGPFVSKTYVGLSSAVSGFNSNIPIVVVDTKGQLINDSMYTRCFAAFMEKPVSGGRVNITDSPDFVGRCGIRIRGSSTAGEPKHQYSLETWDERNNDEPASLLGLSSDSDWVLYGPSRYDTALINNALAYELSNQVGRYAPRTRACELYLNTSSGSITQSHYVGLYYLVEKIRVNNDRVDIASLEPWDTTEPKVTGGYILAIDRADPDGPGFYTSRGTGLFNYVDPKEPEVITVQKNWIRSYLNQFESVLYNNLVFKDPVNGYAKYIDVGSHIDHSLLNMLPMNVDAFRLSGYMAKHRGGLLHAGPIWDFDRALDSTDSRDDNPYAWNGTGDATQYFSYVWYGRLHQDIDFYQRYIDRWYEFRRGQFSTASIEATIDTLADEIREAAVRNYTRWSIYPARFGGFQGEIDHMKWWLRERSNWIDNQYVKPPTISPDGGHVSAGATVTLANPNGTGTIYYTTDGTDPRVFAGEGAPGGVSPTAVAYTGPIQINGSTQIKARVLVASNPYSPWSGWNSAKFGVTPVVESLRVTEIMYHPKETGDPNDPNQEYIELRNIGPDEIDLNLVRFTNGIDFTFPDMNLASGEYAVVVHNLSVFNARYPDFSGTIAGEYPSRLENAGERIRLEDATEEMILDFEFGDWYDITDGGGHSLTIINPNDVVLFGPDEDLFAHWRFDDGAGSTVTDSAGSNHGTISGSPAWVPGPINGALQFHGAATGDSVSVDAITPLNGSSLTVQAWVKPANVMRVWNPILTQHDTGGNGYYLYIYANRPTFSVSSGGGTAGATSLEYIVPDEWLHIAGTNDGTNIKLYVDGELKASTPSIGRIGTEHDACIGYDYKIPTYYVGVIDDLRIYDRALYEYEFQGMTDSMERWSRKYSWRPSAYDGGSPGYDDSGIIPNPGAVVINEVLAHSHGAASDWFELYNTTNGDINIGGWYLSDSDTNLMMYRIADDTILAARDYIVFYEDANFGPNSLDPGKITGFAFSENGDQLYLTAADNAGVLTGYRDVEDFGASPTGVSFGRYLKMSTNNANFVLMDHNTPGAANAYPKVGPVVISEIMYNPQDDDQNKEYIEILNITSGPVSLYDYQENEPWKFTNGISFKFPGYPGFTMPPNARILIAKDIPAYIAEYGMPPWNVFLLGPYAGNLSNSGEKVDLSMPGDVDEYGNRYYIRVDRVNYSDGSHPDDNAGNVDLWPTNADAGGASLVRIDPNLYGNDPNNWTYADPPTPGLP